MYRKSTAAIARTARGIGAALRSRWGVVLAAAAAVAAFNLVAPVAILSVTRRPPDFFTFNPWLPRLADYVASDQPLQDKVSFLSNMAIAWVSADNKDSGGVEGVDWSFIVDVPMLGRILLTSLVFGSYFALWSYWRREGRACGLSAKAARPAGVAGAVTSVLGLTTGPCTLAGCGAPVLPIVGLAFSGLSSGTLAIFSALSRIGVASILAAMALAVLWLGWRVGSAAQQPSPPPLAGASG